MATHIANAYLPSRFRFHSPRYYRQVLAASPSPELDQYLRNRYMAPPKIGSTQLEAVLARIRPAVMSVFDLIGERGLYSYVREEIVPENQMVNSCNFALIEEMQAYRLISEEEAIALSLREAMEPGDLFLSLARTGSALPISVFQEMADLVAHHCSQRPLSHASITLTHFKEVLCPHPNA